MRHTEYGYVSPVENHCYHDLERWLADKKKRERRAKKHAKKHGAFNLHKGGGDHAKSKTLPTSRLSCHG